MSQPPPYSIYPPAESVYAALAARIPESDAYSNDPDAVYDSSVQEIPSAVLTRGGRIIGSYERPRAESSQLLPRPPAYFDSRKPSLLWLDGGGTRVMIETIFLQEITQPLNGNHPRNKYFPHPYKYFDWIGACGCSSIIAFMIACGLNVPKMQHHFNTLAGELRDGNMMFLEASLEQILIRASGEKADDVPALTNIWLPDFDGDNPRGIRIRKGKSLKRHMLPIVLREVKKELDGYASTLEHTDDFLNAICPDFNDCEFLLSIGSGRVPSPTKQTISQWFYGENKPSPHPRPPRSSTMPFVDSIPVDAYASHTGTYIRLQPDLYQISHDGLQIFRLDDWTTNFGGFVDKTKLYLSLGVTKDAIKRVIYMLKCKNASH